MAKKRSASDGDVNISAAIREALGVNPELSGRECQEAVQAKYPTAQINEKSFQVAYSVTRRKLGLGKSKSKVRRKRPGGRIGRPPVGRVAMSNSSHVSLEHLQLALEFVAKVGGASAATAAIEQLAKLQVR